MEFETFLPQKMSSAKKDICSSLSQAKILLGLLKVKASPVKAFSFLYWILQALFPTSELNSIIQDTFFFAIEPLNHTNICVRMGVSYQKASCYVDFLEDGRDGNRLLSKTI